MGWQKIGRALGDWILVYGMIGIVFSFLGFLGEMHWVFELMSHFRWHYSILCAALLLVSVFRKKKTYILKTAPLNCSRF